ncbi:hypothetical protein STEG23_011600, partial [Scotinomys teguina]
VLWSLEWGHWISEEPFELSQSFPAAPNLYAVPLLLSLSITFARVFLRTTVPLGFHGLVIGAGLSDVLQSGTQRSSPPPGAPPDGERSGCALVSLSALG